MKNAASCPSTIVHIWMKRLPNTGRVSRLAGGRQGCSSSLGPPFPITMASKVTRTKSQNRNCRSAMVVITCTHNHHDHFSLLWVSCNHAFMNSKTSRKHQLKLFSGTGFELDQTNCILRGFKGFLDKSTWIWARKWLIKVTYRITTVPHGNLWMYISLEKCTLAVWSLTLSKVA